MRYVITRRLAFLHRTSCSTGSVLHCTVSNVFFTTNYAAAWAKGNPWKPTATRGKIRVSFTNSTPFRFIDNYRLITTPSNTTAFYYNTIYFYCKLRMSRSEAFFVNDSKHDTFLGRGVVSTSPNPQARGPPLVGCPRLLIRQIRSYPPYWRPLLHPQHEDAPCRGDRNTPIKEKCGKLRDFGWEECMLRVFENRVLRRIFGPTTDEVTVEWRKLHNEELNELYYSPFIVRVIKSRRMRWAGHVARMGERRWGNQRERDHLEDPGVDARIILRLVFRKWDVWVWTGSNWLKKGTCGPHLLMR